MTDIQWPSDDTENCLKDLYTLLTPYEAKDPRNNPYHPNHDENVKLTRERIQQMCREWHTYKPEFRHKIIEKARPFTTQLRRVSGKTGASATVIYSK
jgi:hypothetical protein